VRRITGLDWPLLALAAGLLALTAFGAHWIITFDDPNVGLILLLHAGPYALAAWLILRRRTGQTESSRAVVTILVVAAAMRLLLLPGIPISTDIYRYIWDGRVQGAGINPYLFVPADASLSDLRDAAIFPYINRAQAAPTIYPPAAQIIFYLITRVSQSPIAMKAAMLVFEGIAVWGILQLLTARGQPRSRVLLYAWHPLPLWEFARSGHIDIAAIAFLMLALLASERRHSMLAGVALAISVLVKYFPLAAGPAVYRRWDWRLPLAFVASLGLLYLPYIAAGSKVLGYLPGYVTEEKLDQSSGFFLLQLLTGQSPTGRQAPILYLLAAAIVFAALALFIVLRTREPHADLAGATLLAVVFTILVSPHYAWYFAWLVPFLCFYPLVGLFYLTCAAGYLYFTHWPPTISEGLVIYGPAIFLFLAELGLRRLRKQEKHHGDPVPA
jgi:alpha-1,6-mannosyltransferase